MKLRSKILALFVPLIVLPLLLSGWVAYTELRQTSEERMFAETQAVLDFLETRVRTQINTAVSNIELFAKHTLIGKYVLTDDEDQRYTLMLLPLLRVFQSYQEAFPDYYEIRVILPDGYEDVRQTRAFTKNVTEEEADNPQFKALRRSGGRVYTAVFRNPDNGEISLFVGKPLIMTDRSVDPISAAPRLRGYLVLTVSLQELAREIERTVIGREGYLLATDAEGNVLFQSNTVSLHEPIERLAMDGLLNTKMHGPPARRFFNGVTSFVDRVQMHRDMHLIAVLPERELIAISQKLATIVAAITLITILVTTACLFLALNHLIIRPIYKLRHISRQVGRGNWDVQSDVNSRDEIGDLATAFEEMASNLKNSDKQVRFLAYHDSLTGLPNRAMFKEYLNHAIARARRYEEQLALLFLDIDHFKRVNDSLGHHIGDELLQVVAERLSKSLREGDFIAADLDAGKPNKLLSRLGGDEFIVLLPNLHHADDAGRVARRLLEVLSQAISVGGHECYTSASIGITLYPEDGEHADDLIKNADVAMYYAKELGRNTFQYYRDSKNRHVFERLALEGKLRRAIDNNELCLYYQPLVVAETGEIVELEALLRWVDPEEGMIPPNVFIPVAEQTGLILPIGEWVLNEACRQNREWQKVGHPPVVVSVNVSNIQFARHKITSSMKKALARSGLDPSYLEIEITESAIMARPDEAVETLERVKSLGVSIALDDFGTGYSSLSYLRRFPIDTLKIDRSFIADIEKAEDDQQIVAAIVAMAHALKLRVVAEGVETPDQCRLVTSMGCDVIQGFLYSRPVPADQIPPLLAKHNLKIA